MSIREKITDIIEKHQSYVRWSERNEPRLDHEPFLDNYESVDAILAAFLEELPAEEDERNGYHKLDRYPDGWNACLTELKTRLEKE